MNGQEQVSAQGSYGKKESKFQYIPGWIELNFQDIPGTVYRTSDQCAQVFMSMSDLINVTAK